MSRDPRRTQWRAIARSQLRSYVRYWAWPWALAVVLIAATIALIDAVGTVNVSIVQFVRSGVLVWFLFALGISVASGGIGPHVANGMTRRSFTLGSIVAGLAAAILHALTAAGLVLLEGRLYARMGWDHDAAPGEEYVPGVWERGVGPLLLDHTLVTVAGLAAGLLVGMTYYRFGGWWGTVALPLTLLPIIYTMFATSWSEAPFVPWDDVPPGTAHVVGAAAAAAAVLAFAALTRRVPISRSEA